MALLAHHTEAFLQIEINGRSFPDGMTEHGIALALGVLAVSLMAYGAFAVLRDWLRWRGNRMLAGQKPVQAGV